MPLQHKIATPIVDMHEVEVMRPVDGRTTYFKAVPSAIARTLETRLRLAEAENKDLRAHFLHIALNDAEAALRAARPEETVCVPVELNSRIRLAIIEANAAHERHHEVDGVLRSDRIWRSIVAAAAKGAENE